MTTLKFPELDELEGKIAHRQKEAAQIVAEARSGDEGTLDLSKVTVISGDSAAKALHLTNLNTELAELNAKAAPLRAMLAAAEADYGDPRSEKGGDDLSRRATKSIGQLVAKSAVRTGGIGTKVDLPDVDLKTLMSRSAGWDPETFRDPGYVPYPSAPIMIIDLIPMLPTTRDTIKYMEQTTRTNNAAERAEGGTYGEAAFALTERSVPIETVGVWLPVTDEQLEDEPEAAAMIDMELPMMVRQRLDSQILVGDGSTPNILGINNKSSIQTQAKSTDPVFDAVLKGITKVRVTGRATPDAVVFHPNDWQDIRLTRTTDGIYILGNPNDPAPAGIWGLTVAQSDNQTENTAVVGAFRSHARLRMRRDVVIEKTNSHDTFFINGKQAIRAGLRCATVWNRATAFCQVTGI